MKMAGGWTGKILRIDLTDRKWSVEPTERFAEKFVGGIGIGLKIFCDEVASDTGAFDPENRLVFAPGPLTGTLAPASGRMEIISKSPRSFPRETVLRSGMGGHWGAELKYAGYDSLIVQGAADSWLNLWIFNDQVEFRDAGPYLEMDTHSTQVSLRKELDPRARIVCIGPAGENLSRLAVILSETSFASGRSGFGAVMGSKRLKAIAVRGTTPLKVSDSARLIDVSREVRRLTAGNPMGEWTTRNLNEKERKAFIQKYRKKSTGCSGCPLQCFAHLVVPGSGESATHCSNYYYYPKATRYYGETLERDQAVSDAYLLANRLGLDTYEHRRMLDFLQNLYEAGQIKATEELPLDQVGSREFIRRLLEAVAWRKGMGDLLSEGCVRSAEQISGSRNFVGRYFPAHGSAAHGTEQMRDYPGLALMWALDGRDPFIDHHAYLKLAVTDQIRPEPYRLPNHTAKALSRRILGSEEAIDHSTFKWKPEAVIYAQNRAAVVNLLVLCDWIYPVFSSPATEDWMGDTSLESRLLSAVTGNEWTEEELDRVGERVWNVARVLMALEGRSRRHDTLHESYFRESHGLKPIPELEFEESKTIYYRLRGWDESTGWPTKETLRDLGLPDLASLLERETDRDGSNSSEARGKEK